MDKQDRMALASLAIEELQGRVQTLAPAELLELAKLLHQPQVMVVRPRPVMDEAAIKEAFRGWSDEDARWKALWQVLGEEIEAELGQMASPDLSDPGKMWLAVGGLRVLLMLRGKLCALRGRA